MRRLADGVLCEQLLLDARQLGLEGGLALIEIAHRVGQEQALGDELLQHGGAALRVIVGGAALAHLLDHFVDVGFINGLGVDNGQGLLIAFHTDKNSLLFVAINRT